jgi:hypothetical protein
MSKQLSTYFLGDTEPRSAITSRSGLTLLGSVSMFIFLLSLTGGVSDKGQDTSAVLLTPPSSYMYPVRLCRLLHDNSLVFGVETLTPGRRDAFLCPVRNVFVVVEALQLNPKSSNTSSSASLSAICCCALVLLIAALHISVSFLPTVSDAFWDTNSAIRLPIFSAAPVCPTVCVVRPEL